MNGRRTAPVGIGLVTILTVLLVLTLSVFAALTLSSARADLALSRTNAETVSAWYAADAQAAGLYARFASGEEPELEEFLPITQRQSLYLHLVRGADGTVEILAWQAVAAEADMEEGYLPVWDGQGFD